MLRIDIDTIKPGMALALPARHPKRREQVLLREGYEVAGHDVRRLREVGLTSLWIKYPGLEFLRRYINPRIALAQEPIIERIALILTEAQATGRYRLPYKTSWASIHNMVAELLEHPSGAVFLGETEDATLDRLVRHSHAVTYLSLLMGVKLEGYLVQQRRHVEPSRAKELVNLGIGAALHDLGVVKLPFGVYERHNRTGDDGDPEWREHTSLGYEMVRGAVAPSSAVVVLNHHQRMDGTGFAGRGYPVLEGQRIHVFPRVVAVADRFDRLCHPHDKPSRPAVWGLSEMSHPSMVECYDPNVLKALFTVVPPYPPGSVVRLSDGRYAVCIEHDPEEPCRPRVQVISTSGELDPFKDGQLGPVIELRESGPGLYVTECGGVDVSEMNFTLPEVLRDPYHHVAGTAAPAP